MPVLIDTGDGNPVKVNIDGIEDMAPDQQVAAVQSVTATLHAQGHVNAGPQATPQPSQPPDTSWGGALHHGLAEAAQGLGSTISTVGQLAGSDTLQGAGKSVSGAVSEPAGYQPTDIPGALRQGDYMGALKQLPRAAAEYAPQLAGQLAGAAAGSAVAGPVGAAVGAGGATALENFGPNVQARAAANNDTAPSTSDAVVGGLTTAAQSALAGVGIPVGKGLGAIARPLTQIAADTGVGAGNEALREVGTTAGTDKGLSVDPAQIGAAGLQAGVSRAASVVPGAAREGIQAATDQAMSHRVEQPANEDHAASIVRVKQQMDAIQQSSAQSGDAVPATTAANNLKNQLRTNIQGYLNELADAGVVDKSAAREAAQVIIARGERHNNVLNDDDLAYIRDTVLRGVNPDVANPILNDARDLNTVSTQSFKNATTGPLQQLGSLAGRVIGPTYELMHGNVMGAAGAAILGHGIGAKIGSSVGRMGDTVLGLSKPPVSYQQMAAQRMLAKQGLDAGNTLQTVPARAAVSDIQPTIAAMNDPGPVIKDTDTDIDPAIKAKQMDAMQKQRDADAAVQARAEALQRAQTDKAYNAVQPARNPQVEDYLAGKLKPPSDNTAPLGAQTASEIAVWQQMLNNTKFRQKLAKGQLAVLDQAASDDRSGDPFSITDPNAISPAVKARQLAQMQALQAKQKVQQAKQIQASMELQGKANDPAQQSAQDQIEAYLSGKLNAPTDEPSVSVLNRQTRAEMSARDQMLANARTRSKMAALQQKVLTKASDDQVDNLAQRKVDAASKKAAVDLQAASVIPSERGDVPGVAQAAAVARAHRAAAGVLNDAGQLPEQARDAISVGNPGAMVTPEGAPVNLDGTPLEASRPRLWRALRAPEAPTPGEPQAAPTGSVEPPEAMSPTPGVPAYLDNHLQRRHGIPLTKDVWHAAIDAAQGAGDINPIQARSYREGPDMGMSPEERDMFVKHIAGVSQKPSSSQGAQPEDRTVRRPIAYKIAADTYHSNTNRDIAELEQLGMPAGAALLREIRDANNQTRDTNKTAIFNKGLEQLDPATAAAVRARVTAGQLSHGKPKAPKGNSK
jgi:hypothetical protein